MLNDSLLNVSLINGSSSFTTSDVSLSDTLNISLNSLFVGPIVVVSDTININSISILKQINSINETINILLSQQNKVISKTIVIDYISLLSNITLSIKAVVNESLIFSSSLIPLFKKIGKIIELVNIEDSVSTKVLFATTLLDLLSILSLTHYGKPVTIIESINLLETITQIQKSISDLVSSLSLVDALSKKVVSLITINSIISYNSSLSNKVLFKSLLKEDILLFLPSVKGQDNYLSYLYSPETNGLSNYNNYNFDNCTKFGSKYLFSNSSGLFEYGGNTDDQSLITAKLETIAYDFGSSNLKQVPAVYLGYSSSNSIIMKVSVDGKNTSIYKLNKRTNNLQSQKVEVGKGLIGRYFQFELITEAPDFSMESIEFYPLELKRKL